MDDKNLIRLGTENGGVVIDGTRFVGASFESHTKQADNVLHVVLHVANGQFVTLTLHGTNAKQAYAQLHATGQDVDGARADRQNGPAS